MTGHCPVSPISQAPGSQCKGSSPNQAGDGGNSQSPHRPLLCDMEGNRRERPEYGNQKSNTSREYDNARSFFSPGIPPLNSSFPACLTSFLLLASAAWCAQLSFHGCSRFFAGSFSQVRSHPFSGGELKTDPSVHAVRAPSVDEHSQCSDTEVDHDLNSDHNHKHLNRCTTDTYTINSESGMEPEIDFDPDGTSRCLSSTAPMGATDGADTPLSDEELEKDFEVECMRKETYDMVCKENRSSYVEFPSIEPFDPASFSSYMSSCHSDGLLGSSSSNSASAMGAAANDSTSPSSDPGIADMNQKGYLTSDQDRDLSSPGSESDIEGELEAAFACGGPVVSNMISSISETELDLTSEDSSSGRSSHLTNSIEEASSPTSDQELDPDTELEQDSGIVGLKASLLLGQPDPIKEGSSLPSPSPLPSPTIATPSPVDSPILPPEAYNGSQAMMGRWIADDEQSCEHQADPDETLPAQRCEDSFSKQMVLQIEPDHSLESIKRSFYLPVGPRLMPNADEYDETSEGDSESESEDELSENSDSPWLLSNLVNRMISEGSYPISCPEDCFKRKASVSDTISPSSDIGDGDGYNDDEQEKSSAKAESEREERECKNYRMEKTTLEERRTDAESPNETAIINHCLYMSNRTNDTITPLNLELCANKGSTHTTTVSENNLTDKSSKNARRQDEEEEPNNDLIMLEGRKDLDSPSLSESIVSDKDEGRETKPRPTSRSSASLERITEVKNSLTLDIPNTQANHCFSLTYSTDNDEDEEDNGDSYPYLDGLRKQTYRGSDLELDSSPPIDTSGPDHSSSYPDRPLCEKDLRQPEADDGLAYDSVKYTLVVDENTTLELVSLKR